VSALHNFVIFKTPIDLGTPYHDEVVSICFATPPLAATHIDLSNGVQLELSFMSQSALRKKAVSFAWAFGILLIIYLFPLTTVVFLGLVLV